MRANVCMDPRASTCLHGLVSVHACVFVCVSYGPLYVLMPLCTCAALCHVQVMVLFCDVVGFTSMSKEVEPSQVCVCLCVCETERERESHTTSFAHQVAALMPPLALSTACAQSP